MLAGSGITVYDTGSCLPDMEPYHYFPAYGFIGYAITIALLLVALAQSEQRWHYVLVSFTLIKLAGFDIVLSRQEIAERWQ